MVFCSFLSAWKAGWEGEGRSSWGQSLKIAMNSSQSPGWFQSAPRTPRVLHSLSLHNSCHFYLWGAGTAGDLFSVSIQKYQIALIWPIDSSEWLKKCINSDALWLHWHFPGETDAQIELLKTEKSLITKEQKILNLKLMAFSTLTRKGFFREVCQFVFLCFPKWEKKSNDFGEPMAGIDLIIRTHLNVLHGHGHLFRQEQS